MGYHPDMTTTFPTVKPVTPLLAQINADLGVLRSLDEDDLQALANEVRQYMLFSVSQTGGHFGAGLGVVELSIALHHVLNTPEDLIRHNLTSLLQIMNNSLAMSRILI